MEEWKEAKRIYARAGMGYMAFLLMGVVLQLEVSMLMMLMEGKGIRIPMDSWGMIMMMLPMYVVGGLICYLVMRDVPVIQPIEQRPMPFGTLALLLLICFSVMYVGNLMGIGLMSGVNGLLGKPFLNPVSETVENMDLWAIFCLMVVAAPVFEELLYRKLLLDRTVQFGDKTAILMSGLVFGISHGNFYQFFYAFGLGVIFAYIYIRTGRIRYTIIFHAIINFFGSVVALQVGKDIIATLIYGMVMLIAVIAGITLLIIYWRKRDIRPGIFEIPYGRKFSVCCGNWGMAVFFFTSLVLFISTEMI